MPYQNPHPPTHYYPLKPQTQLCACVLYTPTVGLMTALWVPDHTIRKWNLPRPCATFSTKYDKVQEQIMQISCMDDLLCGEY